MLKGYVEADYFLEILNGIAGEQNRLELATYCVGSGVNVLERKYHFQIHNYGYVAHKELINAYENSDILVNIAEKRGFQISSKIFEYMSTGKPILHIYYSDSDINVRYLSDYPLSLSIKADRNTDTIEKIASWLQKYKGWRCSYDYVEEKYKQFTPKYITDKFFEK